MKKSQHRRECAHAELEAIDGYPYFEKVGLVRLYRDLLEGEFHPLQTPKQEASLGKFLLIGQLS